MDETAQIKTVDLFYCIDLGWSLELTLSRFSSVDDGTGVISCLYWLSTDSEASQGKQDRQELEGWHHGVSKKIGIFLMRVAVMSQMYGYNTI